MTYFDISPNLERIVIVSLDNPAQASKLVLYALSDVRCWTKMVNKDWSIV